LRLVPLGAVREPEVFEHPFPGPERERVPAHGLGAIPQI